MTFTLSGQLKSGKNRVLITRQGRRYAPKEFSQWRDQMIDQLYPHAATYAENGARFPLQTMITLHCEYTPGDQRTRDVDGMLGALMHVIVKANLLKDDGLVWGVTWRREAMNRQEPKLVFTMEAL